MCWDISVWQHCDVYSTSEVRPLLFWSTLNPSGKSACSCESCRQTHTYILPNVHVQTINPQAKKHGRLSLQQQVNTSSTEAWWSLKIIDSFTSLLFSRHCLQLSLAGLSLTYVRHTLKWKPALNLQKAFHHMHHSLTVCLLSLHIKLVFHSIRSIWCPQNKMVLASSVSEHENKHLMEYYHNSRTELACEK